MKKAMKPSGVIVTLCIAVVFAVTLLLLARPYLPDSLQELLTPDSTSPTDADGETVATRPTIGGRYLYTEPSEWYAVGEDVNWNDQLTLRVENVTTSRTLPTDVESMELFSSQPWSYYEELIAKDEDAIVVDLTASITCDAPESITKYGSTTEYPYWGFGVGNLRLNAYDREEVAIERLVEPIAMQDISENFSKWGYQLDVDETARVRLLWILLRDVWEQRDVLWTFNVYGADDLNMMGYSQPHIWLNESNA